MKGFTLVEVLVSLFILSLVAVTGITSLSYSTKTISSLSDDFYRGTLAENIIIRSYFDENYLTNNLLTQREEFMGYPYIWNRKITIDPKQNSLNIEVEVISEETEKSTKLEILGCCRITRAKKNKYIVQKVKRRRRRRDAGFFCYLLHIFNKQ